MINKIAGYGGFKSYAENPYPSKKQGKELEETNQVWAATKRDCDKINTLDNFSHYHTLYKKQHVENTQPKDYHQEHVKKGFGCFLNSQAGTLNKPYDQVEAEKEAVPDYKKGFNPLKTGTEHWKTNYQADIVATAMNQTLSGSNRDPKFSTMRSQSTGKTSNNKNLIDEHLSKANSYKNRAYINDCQTGTTDYKFNYG